MAAVLDSVVSEYLVAKARIVDEVIVDLYKLCLMLVAAKGDLDDRKGECSKARLLRDDDAKALRQVCAAILRFEDEPISIQKGSQEGAKVHVRELKERMVLCECSVPDGGTPSKMFQRLDFTPRALSIKVRDNFTLSRCHFFHVYARVCTCRGNILCSVRAEKKQCFFEPQTVKRTNVGCRKNADALSAQESSCSSRTEQNAASCREINA